MNDKNFEVYDIQTLGKDILNFEDLKLSKHFKKATKEVQIILERLFFFMCEFNLYSMLVKLVINIKLLENLNYENIIIIPETKYEIKFDNLIDEENKLKDAIVTLKCFTDKLSQRINKDLLNKVMIHFNSYKKSNKRTENLEKIITNYIKTKYSSGFIF